MLFLASLQKSSLLSGAFGFVSAVINSPKFKRREPLKPKGKTVLLSAGFLNIKFRCFIMKERTI